MKTSETHPLRIDSVEVPGTAGRIGMTLCPGKKQPNALSGAWHRDLAVDLRAIKSWGATVLLSLMEEHEFLELGVIGLFEQTTALEIKWIHLPIRDVSIPNSSAEKQWAAVVSELVDRLKKDEKIVLHCKGGLGRTGMMAACLLREFGVGGKAAIDSVRTARHGAIETNEQEMYVRHYQLVT